MGGANVTAAATDAARGKDVDSDSSEEDTGDRPYSLKELRERAKETIAKRRQKKKQHDPTHAEAKAEDKEEDLGYDEMVQERDSASSASSGTPVEGQDPTWPTDDEVNEIFL